MKFAAAFVTTMMAALAAGVGATTALALPDLAVALGGSYPLHIITISETRDTQISDPVEALNGEGLTLEYTFSGLGSTGTFKFTLKNVEDEAGIKCNTAGAAEGEVLIKGAVDVVFATLLPVELALGALFLLEALMIECGAIRVKVRGSVLGPGKEAGSLESVEYTLLGVPLKGNGEGTPEWTKYYNANGEERAARLETNFGAGYRGSAFEAGAVTATAEEGQMFGFIGT